MPDPHLDAAPSQPQTRKRGLAAPHRVGEQRWSMSSSCEVVVEQDDLLRRPRSTVLWPQLTQCMYSSSVLGVMDQDARAASS